MKPERKLYKIKYRCKGEGSSHYKYYQALDRSTAEAMFEFDFLHSHGDHLQRECARIEETKKVTLPKSSKHQK